jgi:lipopolysaccharide assembly outer membrane protein LptD (OstA)
MALFRLFPRALLILVIVLAAGAAGPARAAERTEAAALPPGVKLSAEHISADEKNGAIVAAGAVTIEAGFGRIQADRITFREGHLVEAEGNVLLVWGTNRISGTRMSYDMGLKDDPDPEKRIPRGVIENAVGQVDPEFYFDARQVDTIGDDRVVLHHATVTTCTQPVPYWSFHVSTAKIKLEGYAHMFNLRPAIKKVPFFYLPYLMWPVKRERAPGLLFPEFGATTSRGYFMSIPVFFPLGPSADLTLFPEYYTIGGWAAGAKLRMIPKRDGYAEAQVQYVWDQLTASDRYRVQLKQTQNFVNGFRMVSDVDIVSDFDYFTDFVRNLTYASSPTILGRMTFTRSGPWTSILVQEQYREQLFSNSDTTLVQTALPEIEWRGRSRRIGNSPFYFTYTSSLASLHQNSDRMNVGYYRGDIFPTVSLPFSPRPWLDITPVVAVRSTYWSRYQLPPTFGSDPQTPVTVIDQGLWRNLLSAGIDFRGPKFVRIFETKPKPEKDGKPAVPALKYKNTIEPDVAYTYQQAFDRNNEIIVYDEVDAYGINANAITYSLASRLIAQRPRAAPERSGGTGEKILVAEGESGKLREAPSATPPSDDAAPTAAPDAETKAPPLEPIEIASVSIAQSYSFDSYSSSANLDSMVATPNENSHFSSIALTGRYSPSRVLSFNLTGRYDVLFKTVSDVSLSGNFRHTWAQGLFSVVYRQGLGSDEICTPVTVPNPDPTLPPITVCLYTYVPKPDATQIRFQGNFGPIAGRLRLGIDATYNLSPSPSEVHLPYRRWRVEYYTQCCGFLAEYLASKYTAFPRREFRFAVDLRGIGKLFDFNQANQ